MKCDHGIELTLRCEACEAGVIAGEHRGFARTPPASNQRIVLQELVNAAAEVYRISERATLPWHALAGALKDARIVLAQPVETSCVGWQPIETAPKNRQCLFWVVSKDPDECYLDTSGNPIVGSAPPRMVFDYYGRWSSLSKATHWIPAPESPPKTSCDETGSHNGS